MSGFYRRWIVANGMAEAVGLGTTFSIGILIAPLIETSRGVASVLAGALAAVVLGTALEGVLVGAAQESVLRRPLARLGPGAWTVATAIGAGLAWLVGMIPSTVMALSEAGGGPSTTTEPAAIVQYGLAFGLGAVAGPILGLAQWLVLRRFVPGAWRWLVANALAWAVGMTVIFVGMDRVPWNGSRTAMFAAIFLVCGASGSIVGAIHGRVLLRLLEAAKGFGPPAGEIAHT